MVPSCAASSFAAHDWTSQRTHCNVRALLDVVGPSGTLVAYTGWEATFTWSGAVLAFGVSLAVGVLSGLFPAWRASRLDPIQALRYE